MKVSEEIDKEIKFIYNEIHEFEKDLLKNFKTVTKKKDLLLNFLYKSRSLYESVEKSGDLDKHIDGFKIINNDLIELSNDFLNDTKKENELNRKIFKNMTEILILNNVDKKIIDEKMKLLNYRILTLVRIHEFSELFLGGIYRLPYAKK